MRRVDLEDLTAFAAVASHRSFRRAALALGVTPSALSHTLRRLEERLGLRLLNRTTRSVAPTAAGEALLARLAPALGEIEGALAAIDGFRDTPSGPLRLNVPRSAVHLALMPAVAPFLRRYPQVRLDIVVENSLVDIVEAGFDAGIRVGENLQRDMIAIPLGPPQRFAVVGSPGYFARRGVPADPFALAGHDCIGLRFPNGTLYRWEFEKDGEELAVEVPDTLTVSDQDLMIAPALAGVGLAFIFEAFAAPYLETGRLCRVLADWCPVFPGFHLYYPSGRQMPAALRAFIDMLREEGASPQ